MLYLLVVFMVALGAFGTLLLKIGAEKVIYTEGALVLIRTVAGNPILLVGMVMQVIPLVSWVVLLKFMPLTKLQPMIALTYVITPLLAVVFLGEHVGGLRAAGIAMIVIGVVLVGMS